MSRAKQKSLLLLAIAGGFILILAMSLPGLVLSPGQPFSLGHASPDSPGNIDRAPTSAIFAKILQGVLALALILLPFSILYALSTPEGRKRLIRYIVLIALLLWAADYMESLPQNKSLDQLTQIAGSLDETGSMDSVPVATFPEKPPEWLTIAVILVASLLIAALVGGVVWFLQQREQSPELVLEKLAEEVQNAIVSIHEGSDFKTTIIHCYREMSRVLREKKGFVRENFMTPREFERRLVEKGFSRESITTLTRLFEQVRYGTIPTGTKEKNLALSCLTDIVDACKAIGDTHDP